MAVLDDLLQKVSDPVLRDRLTQEIRKATKHKKFGLVFEEHLPECTPLYDVPVKKGSHVAVRDTEINETFTVLSVKDGMAKCISNNNKEQNEFLLDNLVAVAEFGEPIYPYLQTIDTVCNAPDSDLWHTLIEADNYHALQLLEYMYAGKVDCIYIDPPYNKEDSKDWKYNCNYVDKSDVYRHSKWLSMMDRRLRLAKKLLNPKDSVLIVTIDEKEYLHLGMLLEKLFPEARTQMVSDVINPRGTTRDGSFSRTDEYIYILQFGNNTVAYPITGKKHYIEWYRLRRTDFESRRGTVKGGTQQFYPIYVDTNTEKIVKVGDPIPPEQDRNTVPQIDGCVAVFPIKNDGTEMNWGVTPDTLKELIKHHFVRVRKNSPGKPQPYLLHYISYVQIEAVKNGYAMIEGYNKDGTAIVVENEGHIVRPGTAWNIPSHNAGTYGSEVLASIVGEKLFSFPKSLYSLTDVLRYFLRDKDDALVLDYFAGSGTTLHAINLLNAELGGKRRCIIVTNNEIGYKNEISMRRSGHRPGDSEWEAVGIAKHIAWPRTVCSIKGKDINGIPLKGKYITSLMQEYESDREIKQIDFISDINTLSLIQKKHLVSMITNGKIPQKLVEGDSKYIVSEDYDVSVLLDVAASEEWIDSLSEYEHVTRYYVIADNKTFKKIKKKVKEEFGPIIGQKPVSIEMSDGFKANAIYFKLGFLDKNAVAFGRQFKELLGVLWMKAGAIGPCPHLAMNAKIPEMMILPQNKMAILINDTAFAIFEEQMKQHPEIETVYIVTDSDRGYREMLHALDVKNTYQLYRDYLDNFRINHRR